MQAGPDWFVSFKLALHVLMLCIGLAAAWNTLLERLG